MKSLSFISALVFILFAGSSYSQIHEETEGIKVPAEETSSELSSTKFDVRTTDNFKKIDLSRKILNPETISGDTKENITPELTFAEANSKKSAGISMLLSLVLPGAGHYYINRMDVGQYFLAGDALSWIGLIGVNVYGNQIQDDSRTFSVEHAGVNEDGKDDDYYTSIGSYMNVYAYNNEVLSRGEYNKVYDTESFYWNWDNTDNMGAYETQRKKSERIKNTTVIFASALVVNRIASAISALILTNKYNNSLEIKTDVIKDSHNDIDGFQINLIKNF